MNWKPGAVGSTAPEGWGTSRRDCAGPAGHQRDCAVYVDPKKDLWNRQNLNEFEKQVEAKAASVRGAPPVTGITSDISHAAGWSGTFIPPTLRARPHLVLVLIDLRDIRQTLIAVSVLALGLPMLVLMSTARELELSELLRPADPHRTGHDYERVHDAPLPRGAPRRVWRR